MVKPKGFVQILDALMITFIALCKLLRFYFAACLLSLRLSAYRASHAPDPVNDCPTYAQANNEYAYNEAKQDAGAHKTQGDGNCCHHYYDSRFWSMLAWQAI